MSYKAGVIDIVPLFSYTQNMKGRLIPHCTRRHQILYQGLKFFAYAVLLVTLIGIMKGETLSESAIDFYKHLPSTVRGWEKKGQPEVYDRKTLFKYIDGAAELYISYHFEKLTAVRYMKGDDEIKVDIFDMGNSYNAYGVFSLGRESSGTEIGQGSEYSSGLLNFWKDRYYVSILAYPETHEKRQVLFKLGSEINRLIPQTGPLPPILSGLPSQGLIPESIRYVRHHVWLNNHYFISNDNILLIDSGTEAVIAAYRGTGKKYVVILLKYRDRQQAQKAEKSFITQYLDRASSGLMQLKNGCYTGVKGKENRLALVLEAPDKKTLEDALNRILATLW